MTTQTIPSLKTVDPKVAQDLQSTLVDLTQLALQGKQAHWTVRGPMFRPLHLQLDEMVNEFRIWGDDVAERMAALGTPPDGRAGTVAASETVESFPEGWVQDTRVIDLFVSRLETVSARLRERMDRLNELEPVSGDMILQIVQGLEKQLWMLRSLKS